MSYVNKILLKVKKDRNGWYNFGRNNLRVQLTGDTRKDGFFLEQAAKALGKDNFMSDLTDILKYMEERDQFIFTVYELSEVIKTSVSDC